MVPSRGCQNRMIFDYLRVLSCNKIWNVHQPAIRDSQKLKQEVIFFTVHVGNS